LGENKWGQINIYFQSKGAEAKGGFLMVGYHKSSAPISLCPLRLEINVDLTPFVLPQLNFSVLEGFPHFNVALCGPDAGVFDAGGFVVSAGYVKRQAVFVDEHMAKHRVHAFAGVGHGGF